MADEGLRPLDGRTAGGWRPGRFGPKGDASRRRSRADTVAVAVAHSTTVASAWSGWGPESIRSWLNRIGKGRGRGRPSLADMAREAYRDTCSCPMCMAIRAERRRAGELAKLPKCSACGDHVTVDDRGHLVHAFTLAQPCADGFEIARAFHHDLEKLGLDVDDCAACRATA